MPMRPRAILFDMDGTLTEPLLDFPRIKREMGIEGRPILEALAEMHPSERDQAERILLRHEDEAAAASTLNPGCQQLLALLEERSIPIALITRNSRSSTRRVLERHGLSFEVLITREDGPFKPDPGGLIQACAALGVPCGQAWMVGDGQYDIEAGLAAGARTLWVSHGRPREFAAQPWRTVRDLLELTQLLEMCLSQ